MKTKKSFDYKTYLFTPLLVLTISNCVKSLSGLIYRGLLQNKTLSVEIISVLIVILIPYIFNAKGRYKH